MSEQKLKPFPFCGGEAKVMKWVKMSDADGVYWACGACGEALPRIPHFNPQFDLFPTRKSINRTNYCPHCGVKMKEVKNE